MAPNSLFAQLLRSPWWVSVLLAIAASAVARLVFPKEMELYALFSGTPFLVIAGIVVWKSLHRPSPARVTAMLDAVSRLPWERFAAVMEHALGREGDDVTRLSGPAADFTFRHKGRIVALSCRRWKASRVGVEPLRELQAAMTALEAARGVCVTLGEPTEQAAAYARANEIEFLRGERLAKLLEGVPLDAR